MADEDGEGDTSSEEEEEIMDLGFDLNEHDPSSDTSEEEEADKDNSVHFDPTLPACHSYMGNEMEEVSGRTVHEDEDIVILPLLAMQSIALVPGQILPLNVFHPQSVAMLKRVIEADKTFGLVHKSSLSDISGNDGNFRIGTTAEIFSYKEDTEYGVTILKIKAEGRQRFEVLELKRQLDGVVLGEVKILPEVRLPMFPADSLLAYSHVKPNMMSSISSHYRYRVANEGWKSESRKCKKITGLFDRQGMNCSMSAWPTWVYNIYNPIKLMDQLYHQVSSWNPDLKLDCLSTDPGEFSHWMTANLPLDDKSKLELLTLNCPIERLRRQLEIIKKCSIWCCTSCGSAFAEKANLFSMAIGGPLGAYVNPGGYVHETVTFYKAENLRLRGRASIEHSWFPGYAWTIAECKQCGHHIGWRFTAEKRGLKPSKFWGLSRTSLVPTIKNNVEEQNTQAVGGFQRYDS